MIEASASIRTQEAAWEQIISLAEPLTVAIDAPNCKCLIAFKPKK